MIQLPTIDTPREPVTDTYHGVEVADEYQWLENQGSEATREWTAAQDARARAYLEALPFRDAIRHRFEEILKVESTSYDELSLGGSTYFALKTQPPLQQPFLLALDGLDDTAGERVLVDPNALDESGATTIDWYSPSPDGSRVAVSLSEHGTEGGSVCVYDAASGETVDGRCGTSTPGRRAARWLGARTRAGSGTPGTPRRGRSRTRTSASTKRCGFTSWARMAAGESSRACSPRTGSPRTSWPRRPMGAGRWTWSRRAIAASGRSSCAGSTATRPGGWSPTSATSASARCSAAGRCLCSRCAAPPAGRCCASSSATRRASPMRRWSCRRAIYRSRRLWRPTPGCGWWTSTAAPRTSARLITTGTSCRTCRCRRSARSIGRARSAP